MIGNGFYSGGAIIARGIYYGGGDPKEGSNDDDDDEKDDAAIAPEERMATSADGFTEALASSSSGTPPITDKDAIDYMRIFKGLGTAFLMLSGAAAGNSMFGSNRPWDSSSAQRAMTNILHDEGATYSDWLFPN